MKPTTLIVLSCLVFLFNSSKGSDFPVATATDKPNFVISPFDSERVLDVEGIEPGGLAEDPVAKRIFRLPSSSDRNPVPRAKTVIQRDEAPANLQPNGFVVPGQSDVLGGGGYSTKPGPTASTSHASPREEIEQLMDAFTRSGGSNDPASSVSFMHSRVEEYYGTKWPSHSYLLRDRRNFIKRWPHRSYWMVRPPEINENSKGGYTVVRHMGYKVSDHHGKSKRGNVISVADVVYTSSGWKINRVCERK